MTLVLRMDESGQAGGGWVLHLDSVEGDSRCPVAVQCVRAGDATVVLAATSPERVTAQVRIVVEPAEGSGAVAGLQLRVLGLEPQPRSDRPIAPGDYVVTVEARRD